MADQSRPQRDMEALHAFIDARQRSPHQWGRKANDCVAFVLGAIEATTGRKVARKERWKSRSGALRIIRRYASLEAAFDTYFERIAPALAMRGDIAGVPDDEFGIHPMIVEGVTLVGPGESGNRRLPRSAMAVAWSATKLKP